MQLGAVHVDLAERPTVPVGTVGLDLHVPGGHQCLQAPLGCVAARFIQFGRIDVGEPHFAMVADESVAIDGETALSGERTHWQQQNDKQ